MLKNNFTAISKKFLICLCVICLMCTALGFLAENSYAIDLNETSDELELEYDTGDKLENSQTEENMEVNSQDNEMLQARELTPKGNTFKDIQTCINNAAAGDTILLNGTYKANVKNSQIIVDRQLTITSSSGSVLDGQKISSILNITKNGAKTVISNIKCINSEGFSYSSIYVEAKDVTIMDCSFENSHSRISGVVGTVYSSRIPENFKIKNCNFTNNSCYAKNFSNFTTAGALSVYGLNSQIINCIFDSNWIKGDKESYGGALQVGMNEENYHAKVVNCTFLNNRAISTIEHSHGGAGCVRTGVEYINCTFINNSAGMGGALTMHASGVILNCKFINNTATDLYGGAVSTGYTKNMSMILNILNCTFDNNRAPEGGAIQAIGSNVNIVDSVFYNNYAQNYGGAIKINAKNVDITDSSFVNNTVDVDGGAIFIKGDDTVVKNSHFISNKAIPDVKKLNDGLGGAIYVNSTQTTLMGNEFRYNTARNGSAVYHDILGEQFYMINNILYQNQAWVYALPISCNDIYFGDDEQITVVIYGGNNIADYDNLAVSNAIYNAAGFDKIEIDAQCPVDGATDSGKLYQDGREYNIPILLTVWHEDGTVIYNGSDNSSYLGEIGVRLTGLKPGKYFVSARHFEDTYYKAIENVTSFRVVPLVDTRITKSVSRETLDYEDVVVWTLNITNDGPNDATGVKVYDKLPEGLIFQKNGSAEEYDPETGMLDVGNLSVGENVVFKIVAVVAKTGDIVNRANVTSYENDTNLTNNFDEMAVHVNPACDLAVVKSVNNSKPNYRDYVNWTIEVTNNGPDIAYNVSVKDVLPESLIYVGNDRNYVYDTGIWDIGEMAKGEKIRLNIQCIVNKTGLIENTVLVNGSEYDYDLSNNNHTQRIFVNPASDLAVVKSANVSEANYGDFIKWTLTISNGGPDNASNVKVQDMLPEGLIFIKHNLTKGNYSNGVFSLNSLGVGETVVFDIICKVNATGNHTNRANISSDSYDYNLTNNYDSESVMVNASSDLAVEKTVDESEAKFGDTIIWTVEVTNNGPDDAHSVRVYDLLPDSLIWISDDSENKYDPLTGLWNISVLDVGGSAVLNIVCQVNGTGLIENSVNVTAEEYDHNLTNNHDNETVDVELSADVSVVKTVNNTSPNYGDLVKWTLVISNNGPDKATEIRVDEALPEGMIFVSYNATKGIYGNSKWVMCCLEVNEVRTLDIICRVNKTGKITNWAVIRAEEYDNNETNNMDNESVDVPPAVDIEVSIEPDNDELLFGEIVTWTITVKNNGPDNATNVSLVNILPEELVIYSPAGPGENPLAIGPLNAGQSRQINISTVVNALGMIKNSVNAASLVEYDWNMSNNLDDASVNVKPVCDLEITKSADVYKYNYGDLVKWRITARNNGPNDAENVVVYDVLPDGMNYVRSDGNYGKGIWNVGKLKSGESKELEIVCKVTSTGRIMNHAEITGDCMDSNLDNNHDEESVFVAPASDLSVTKMASKYYYKVGDVIDYVIEIVNNGPDTAHNIKVNEILDDLLVLKSFKVTKGKFNKLNHVWTIDSLGYGESAILHIKAIARGEGIIKNLVSVSSDSFDPDLSNNDDYAIVNVTVKLANHPLKPKLTNNKTDWNLKDSPVSVLQEHPTANPFAALLLSVILFLLFVGDNISNKR